VGVEAVVLEWRVNFRTGGAQEAAGDVLEGTVRVLAMAM